MHYGMRAADQQVRWPLLYLPAGLGLLVALGVGLGAVPGLDDVARQIAFDVTLLGLPLAMVARLHAPIRAVLCVHPMTITRGRAAWWIFLGSVAAATAGAVYVTAFDVHGRTWITAEHPHRPGAIVLGVSAVTLVPVAEEAFWRGFVHRSLRARLGIWVAITCSSTMFGLAHWLGGDGFSTVPPRVFYGALLALLLERTGSLYPGIVAHAYINLAVLDHFAPSLTTPAVVIMVVALIVAIVTSVNDPRRKRRQGIDQAAAAPRAATARRQAHNSGRLGTW